MRHVGMARVVATGEWIYAGSTPKSVFVVAANYDFWYELAKADGGLEVGEEPCLNADGLTHYVSFHGVRADGSFWPDSAGFHSIADAKVSAESRLPSPVVWCQPEPGE